MITKQDVSKLAVPHQQPPRPSTAGLSFGLDVMELRRQSLQGKRVLRKVKP